MKLWLLRPMPGLLYGDNPWEPWYDKCFGLVICAASEERARQIADDDAGDENSGYHFDHDLRRVPYCTKHPWLNPKYSSCAQLVPTEEGGVIIRDFHSA